MPPPTLLLTATMALASATAFVTLGVVSARRTPRLSTLGSLAFPAFWHSAGIVYASQGLRPLAAALGYDSWPLIVALEQISTPFYCMAGAALTFYVLFLLTGRASLAIPVTLYYLVMLVLLRFHVQSAEPIDYVVTEWQVNYVYAGSLQTTGYSIALALTSAPLFAAIAGYLTLAWRFEDPTLRWRIGWIGAGLVLWIGAEVLTFATGLAATPQGELLRRGTGLATVAIALVGYARAPQRAPHPHATPE